MCFQGEWQKQKGTNKSRDTYCKDACHPTWQPSEVEQTQQVSEVIEGLCPAKSKHRVCVWVCEMSTQNTDKTRANLCCNRMVHSFLCVCGTSPSGLKHRHAPHVLTNCHGWQSYSTNTTHNQPLVAISHINTSGTILAIKYLNQTTLVWCYTKHHHPVMLYTVLLTSITSVLSFTKWYNSNMKSISLGDNLVKAWHSKYIASWCWIMMHSS